MGCSQILSLDTWVDLILIIVMGMNFSGMFSTPLCRHMGRSNFNHSDGYEFQWDVLKSSLYRHMGRSNFNHSDGYEFQWDVLKSSL